MQLNLRKTKMKRIIFLFCLLSAYAFGQADSTLVQLQSKAKPPLTYLMLVSGTDTVYWKVTLQGLLDAFQDTLLSKIDSSTYLTPADGNTAYQPKESTLTDIADGTITENLVNTANPWGETEVVSTLATETEAKGFISDSLDAYDVPATLQGGMLMANGSPKAWTEYSKAAFRDSLDLVIASVANLQDSLTDKLNRGEYAAGDTSHYSLWSWVLGADDSVGNALTDSLDNYWIEPTTAGQTIMTTNGTTWAAVQSLRTHTITTDSTLAAALMYGGIFYVPEAQTITLPAVAVGMNAVFITIGAVAVSVNPNNSDKLWLDGTALSDGDKATNTSTTGDMLVITYYSADGFYAASGSNDGDLWTDGN